MSSLFQLFFRCFVTDKCQCAVHRTFFSSRCLLLYQRQIISYITAHTHTNLIRRFGRYKKSQRYTKSGEDTSCAWRGGVFCSRHIGRRCVCVVYKKEAFCLLKPVSLNIVTNLFTRSTYQLTIDTDYVLIASITLSTLFRQTI